jgi:uncharacterized protein (UPF0254 family)
MSDLYNLDTSTDITPYVSVNTDQDVIKVTNRTLDGQYYVQIIGSPAALVNLDVCVDDAGKALLMQADADANLLRVTSSKGIFQGRILECGSWAKIGSTYYETTVKLGVVSS